MCKTYCQRILEHMTKRITPESTSKADMEKDDMKPCIW